MTEVWSCGGGVQSGGMAVLIAQGKLPKPDLAFMVDTGRERAATWPFVEHFIKPQLALAGCDLHIIKKDDFATVDLWGHNGDVLLPGYTDQSGEMGKLPPFCSGEWKRDVGKRWLRTKGVEQCRLWLGISVDEVQRVRTPNVLWMQLRYPLIFEIPLRRHQCVQMIRESGWGERPIPHSACYMCPNLGDGEWIDMKLNHREDFQKACQLEEEIRQRDPHFYLHISCKPLRQVDFFAQQTMFPERGCTEGCFT